MCRDDADPSIETKSPLTEEPQSPLELRERPPSDVPLPDVPLSSEVPSEVAPPAVHPPSAAPPRELPLAPDVPPPSASALPKPVRASWVWLLIGEGILAVVLIAGMFIRGIVRDVCGSGLQLMPFIVAAQLALVAEGRLWARIVGGFWLGSLLAVELLLVATLTAWTALLLRGQGLQAFNDPNTLPLAEMGAAAGWMLVSFAATAVVLYTPLRRLLARLVPFEPTRPVHRTALWLVVSITLGCLVPVLLTSQPLMLALIAKGKLAKLMPGAGRLLFQQALGLAWLIPAAFLAAGVWLTRSPGQTLERLGLRGWTWRQLLFGAVAGLALVAVFELLLDPALRWFWQRQGWQATDMASMERLFGPLMTWVGVFVVSISAGVGEELGLRGLLQPRAGVLLTNLLFMSLHALQYRADGLLSVFLGGLVMGWARKRTNTMVSISIHTFFDIGAFARLRYWR